MMRLRRHLLPIALVALLALVWTALPPIRPAGAQIPVVANGLVMATNASVSITNTTAETLVYQFLIPAAFIASWTANNTAFGAPPIHLRLNGTINTANTAPTATLGVNLGGASATMTVINGSTLGQNLGSGAGTAGTGQNLLSPATLDVWFAPIATLTSTNCAGLQPCSYSLYMNARFAYASVTAPNGAAGSSFATEAVYNAATLGTINVNLAAGQTLAVFWRWGAASNANAVNFYNGSLLLGN